MRGPEDVPPALERGGLQPSARGWSYQAARAGRPGRRCAACVLKSIEFTPDGGFKVHLSIHNRRTHLWTATHRKLQALMGHLWALAFGSAVFYNHLA